MCIRDRFYVIRRMPAPGSAAEKALHERQMRKGKAITKLTLPGLHGPEDGDGSGETLSLIHI